MSGLRSSSPCERKNNSQPVSTVCSFLAILVESWQISVSAQGGGRRRKFNWKVSLVHLHWYKHMSSVIYETFAPHLRLCALHVFLVTFFDGWSVAHQLIISGQCWVIKQSWDFWPGRVKPLRADLLFHYQFYGAKLSPSLNAFCCFWLNLCGLDLSFSPASMFATSPCSLWAVFKLLLMKKIHRFLISLPHNKSCNTTP